MGSSQHRCLNINGGSATVQSYVAVLSCCPRKSTSVHQCSNILNSCCQDFILIIFLAQCISRLQVRWMSSLVNFSFKLLIRWTSWHHKPKKNTPTTKSSDFYSAVYLYDQLHLSSISRISKAKSASHPSIKNILRSPFLRCIEPATIWWCLNFKMTNMTQYLWE